MPVSKSTPQLQRLTPSAMTEIISEMAPSSAHKPVLLIQYASVGTVVPHPTPPGAHCTRQCVGLREIQSRPCRYFIGKHYHIFSKTLCTHCENSAASQVHTVWLLNSTRMATLPKSRYYSMLLICPRSGISPLDSGKYVKPYLQIVV